MIFVTVGTQLPFDRLIIALDDWAGRNPGKKIFAQIGNSTYVPKHMEWSKHIDPDLFRSKSQAAEIIVSHAGMGNVLLALELQKPLILMPRRAELKEHRNDHQMATVGWLKDKPGITIVYDAESLTQSLEARGTASAPPAAQPYASKELLAAIKEFIAQA